MKFLTMAYILHCNVEMNSAAADDDDSVVVVDEQK